MKKKKAAATAATPADALLDAHVAFVLDQLVGEGFEPLVDQLLDLALAEARHASLEQWVTRDTVKAVACAYLVELELRGGIPELVGEVARALHAHPVHQSTRLGDLLSQSHAEALVDQLLALKPLRHRLVEAVLANPLYQDFASDLLYNGIRDYLARSGDQVKIPGAASAFKLGRAVVRRATSGFEDALEDGIKRHIGRSVGSVSQKTAAALVDGAHDASVRSAALAAWQRVRRLKVGELRADLPAQDFDELFKTLRECWQAVRGTPWVGAMIDTGVETVFDRYGARSLADLLDDLGLDRARMRHEAMRFAPSALGRLHQAGRLEPLVRALLAPFYRSGAVERIVGTS